MDSNEKDIEEAVERTKEKHPDFDPSPEEIETLKEELKNLKNESVLLKYLTDPVALFGTALGCVVGSQLPDQISVQITNGMLMGALAHGIVRVIGSIDSADPSWEQKDIELAHKEFSQLCAKVEYVLDPAKEYKKREEMIYRSLARSYTAQKLVL